MQIKQIVKVVIDAPKADSVALTVRLVHVMVKDAKTNQ